MRTQLRVTALAAILSVPAAAHAQTATIVYRLGNDTVAIEQFTRSANRLAGDMVQRGGGAVTRWQYEFTLANGRTTAATVRRLTQEGAPVTTGVRELRFRITGDSIVRETVAGDSTTRSAFAARGAVVVLPTYMYGINELLAAAHRNRQNVDSVPALGLTGGLTFTGLRPGGDNSYRLRGGFYPMLMQFSASGQLQSVDGSETTNKVIGSRDNQPVDLAAIARRMKPTGALSGRDVARATFGAGGIVLVDYGRPSVRDRTVWGGTLVPYDSIWRTGANDATHLFTTRTLTMGTVTVPPGMYTLWVEHTRSGTFLIVNRQTGQWGTVYDPQQDLGRVPMQMTETSSPVEQFTINVRALGGNRGALELAWGPMMGTVPFTATVPR